MTDLEKIRDEFDWELFLPMATSDDSGASLEALEELSIRLCGPITVEDLHVGRYGDELDWMLVRRQSVVIDGEWQNNSVLDVTPISKQVGQLLLSWLAKVANTVLSQEEGIADACNGIDAILRKLKDVDPAFATDLIGDLNELKKCLKVQAFRASLVLCGRILEVTLKFMLYKADVDYDPNSMVGALLKKLEENGLYADQSLKNQFNIINQQRICGVHHKDATPIPSKSQVLGVVHIMCDTLHRALGDCERPESQVASV